MAKKVFFIPDTHFTSEGSEEGGVDEAALSCAMQALEMTKPQEVVHIGDLGEWHSVSHWRWKKKKRPPLEYVCEDLQKEIDATTAGLDVIDAACKSAGVKKKRLLKGNHEVWLDNFIEEHPYLRSEFSLKNTLNLPARKWQVHEYGSYVSWGDLNAYHGGHFTGINHTRAHVMGLGANVIYGHVHDAQVSKVQHLSGYHGAWSIGCLCKLEKAFLKGKPTNWSHNFAVAHIERDGTFCMEVVEIFNGRCYVWGKKITA